MAAQLTQPELPVPEFFDPQRVGEIWKTPYEERAVMARQWARQHAIPPARDDQLRIGLMLVDVQNTFCLPGFELFVGGRSGTGAVDDNTRLAQFIYRSLARLTKIAVTLDTHQALQIFHAIFLIDDNGEHPGPYTQVSAADIEQGRWRFNHAAAPDLHITPEYGQEQLLHYTRELEAHGKYALTIWPYHAMLGGIGHALAPAIEEAIFFHTIARYSQMEAHQKGDYALTESYSAVGPEVLTGPDGKPIARRSGQLFQWVKEFDVLLIAGQAKSHCVAWTIEDLLSDIQDEDPSLAGKIYLLEDCTSPVVVPGADFTDQADAAFRRFAAAGMHVVQSTQAMESWLEISHTSR
jgi:nicotinamidase-related amidase